ncbi:MAG: tRNA (adenine-N1)-methyltransferase [Methanobacteriota archaeon]|nr:MAG: tRNA (adenine-N1)-methyltransferase [Euryarchaeota archaeon]
MERLVLVDKEGRKRLVAVKEGVEKIPGLGVVDFSKFPSNPEGKKIEIAGKEFICLKPSVLDLVQTIEREAQIITPKDSASIVLNCDVKSGDTVLEVGTGSAAMTIVLAYFVAPEGKVISYEKREDFAILAGKNVKRAGFEDCVQIKVQDAVDGIEERGFNSAVVDIPNPWDVLDHIHQSMKPGGHLAVYVPTVNQMEKVVREMKNRSFFDVSSIEIIQREMEVGELGSRPSYETLGHTGYITYARKVVED